MTQSSGQPLDVQYVELRARTFQAVRDIRAALRSIENEVKRSSREIRDNFTAAANDAASEFRQLAATATTVLNHVGDTAQEAADDLRDSMRTAASQASRSVDDFTDDAAAGIDDVGDEARDTAEDVARDFVVASKVAKRAVDNFVDSAIRDLIRLRLVSQLLRRNFSGFGDDIRNVFGVQPITRFTDALQQLAQQFGISLLSSIFSFAAGLGLVIGLIGTVSVAVVGLAAAIGLLISNLATLGATAASAAGALGLLPAAIAGVIAVASTFKLGLFGIGDALKETGQAAGGGGAAVQDFSRQIERASRQVEIAERRVTSAQEDATRAQRALNRARDDAVESLEDLNRALNGAMLDEEAALLAVRDAREELEELSGSGIADPRDIERADLRYRQSLQTLDEVRDRVKDLADEQEEAARKGVEGSDAVIAAHDRQRNAAQALEDAEYQLVQANIDLAEAQQKTAETAGGGGGVASAFSKLAPAAQELVRVLLALKPAWEALRLDVQQNLLVGVGGAVKQLAEVQLPVLRKGLVSIAQVLNRGFILPFIAELSTLKSQSDAASFFSSIAKALDGLSVAVKPLTRALADVLVVGADVISELTGPIGQSLADFGAHISELRESGELKQIFLDGVEAIKQLGSLLADVGGIIAGIGRAAGEGGIFAFFDRLHEFVDDPKTQEQLAAFFKELERLGRALSPVLDALAQLLPPLATALADIAEAAAPFLVTFIEELGVAFQILDDGIVALLPIIGSFAEIIRPLATVLKNLLVAALPGIQEFLSVISGGLSGLTGPAITLGKALGDIIAAAAPLLPLLAEIIATLVTMAAPGIIAFLDALVEGLAIVAPVADLVGKAISDIFLAVAPLLPVIGNLLVNLISEAVVILAALATVAAPLIQIFADLVNVWAAEMLPILDKLVRELLPIFAEVGVEILHALTPLVPVFAELAKTIAGEIVKRLPELVELFKKLIPVWVALAESSGAVLLELFEMMVPVLPELVTAGLDLVVAMAELLIALTPLIPPMTKIFIAIVKLVSAGALPVMITLVKILTLVMLAMISPIALAARALDVVSGAVTNLVKVFGGITSRVLPVIRALGPNIKNAVIGFPTLLFNAGKELINGLIRGIGNALPSALDAVKDVGKSLLKEAKSALGIESPSRVFAREVGQQIPSGIALGIKWEIPRADEAIEQLVSRQARVGSDAATTAGEPAGLGASLSDGSITIENLHLTALDNHFSLDEVRRGLARTGVM